MLEILAVLALVSLAMLGLLKGLLSSQQHGSESLALAQADVQAQNIYEYMQANPVGTRAGGYYQSPASGLDCNLCDPVQQAAQDIDQWQEQLAEELISGTGQVLPWNGGQEISIQWHSFINPDQENEYKLYGRI